MSAPEIHFTSDRRTFEICQCGKVHQSTPPAPSKLGQALAWFRSYYAGPKAKWSAQQPLENVRCLIRRNVWGDDMGRSLKIKLP